MSDYVFEEVPADEIARQRDLYGPLAQSVRELADAVIRTEADDDEIRIAQAEIEAVTKRLRERQLAGSYGVRFNAAGQGRAWGNAVVGLRNPWHRRWWSSTTTAVARGRTSASARRTRVPGPRPRWRLRADPRPAARRGGQRRWEAGDDRDPDDALPPRDRAGDLHAEARIDRVEGYKTYTVGTISDAEGVTVEAEGVFILPKWRARPPRGEPDQVGPIRYE